MAFTSKDNPLYIFGRHLPTEAKGKTIEIEEGEVVGGHEKPKFTPVKFRKVDVPALIKHNERARELKVSNGITQHDAKVQIDTEQPITVIHMGDTHIGSVATDLKEVARKFNTIKETDGVYTVLMGNMIDNAIPSQFPDGLLDTTIMPEQQVNLMREIARKLASEGKVLAAVEAPCHEGWTYKKAGQDVNKLIYDFKGRNFPVLENGGQVTVMVGDQEYVARFYHQTGPFNSNFNDTHAIKQITRINTNDKPDWVAGAHNHVGAIEQTYEGVGEDRKVVTWVRTGSEKGTGEIHDKFIKDRAGKTGEPTGQAVHLYPGERKVLATLEFDNAIEVHKQIRLRPIKK